MKQKTYPTTEQQQKSNTYFHLSSYEATMANKPYIISTSKPATYSKLEKAQKREEKN